MRRTFSDLCYQCYTWDLQAGLQEDWLEDMFRCRDTHGFCQDLVRGSGLVDELEEIKETKDQSGKFVRIQGIGFLASLLRKSHV